MLELRRGQAVDLRELTSGTTLQLWLDPADTAAGGLASRQPVDERETG